MKVLLLVLCIFFQNPELLVGGSHGATINYPIEGFRVAFCSFNGKFEINLAPHAKYIFPACRTPYSEMAQSQIAIIDTLDFIPVYKSAFCLSGIDTRNIANAGNLSTWLSTDRKCEKFIGRLDICGDRNLTTWGGSTIVKLRFDRNAHVCDFKCGIRAGNICPDLGFTNPLLIGCSFDRGVGRPFSIGDSLDGDIKGLFKQPNSPRTNDQSAKTSNSHQPLRPTVSEQEIIARLAIGVFGMTTIMFFAGRFSWGGGLTNNRRIYSGLIAGLTLSGLLGWLLIAQMILNGP